jgi:hypothetical protein
MRSVLEKPFYGWRYINRIGPDGKVEVEKVLNRLALSVCAIREGGVDRHRANVAAHPQHRRG